MRVAGIGHLIYGWHGVANRVHHFDPRRYLARSVEHGALPANPVSARGAALKWTLKKQESNAQRQSALQQYSLRLPQGPRSFPTCRASFDSAAFLFAHPASERAAREATSTMAAALVVGAAAAIPTLIFRPKMPLNTRDRDRQLPIPTDQQRFIYSNTLSQTSS